MKEYCIYVMHHSGYPFLVETYKSSYDAKIALDNMIKSSVNKHRSYFVDNDFYYNKYDNLISGDYYCIKEREVSDWVTYNEYNQLVKHTTGKVIFLKNNEKCY